MGFSSAAEEELKMASPQERAAVVDLQPTMAGKLQEPKVEANSVADASAVD